MIQLYDQTTFSDTQAGTHGDCNRACVATIMQIDPSILPHPIGPDDEWNGAYLKALRELLGVQIRAGDYAPETATLADLADDTGFVIPRVVMAAGPSSRGPWNHAVVWDRIANRMIHDPHPSRDGIETVMWIDYLRPIKSTSKVRFGSNVTQPRMAGGLVIRENLR